MMEQRVDLHVHTTASDGTLSPEQIVQEAARLGLAGVGLTDHDSILGLAEGMSAGERLGVVVVPGVEISTDYGKQEIHMLGYWMDLDSPEFLAHLDKLRALRIDRGIEMVRKLNEVRVMISMDRVREIAGTGSIGRPHVARAIVEAGYASGMNGAFGKFLVRGAPGYVPRYKLTPNDAIQIIREAGGVAVMAHPGYSKHDEVIPDLVDAGMRGIEVYHTEHSRFQQRHYLKIAQKYKLIATGGTDFHGPDMMKMVPLGNVTVGMDVVEALRAEALVVANESREARGE